MTVVQRKIRRSFQVKTVTTSKRKYSLKLFCWFGNFSMVFGHLVTDRLTHHIRCWIGPWRHLQIEARRGSSAVVDAVRIWRAELQFGEV